MAKGLTTSSRVPVFNNGNYQILLNSELRAKMVPSHIFAFMRTLIHEVNAPINETLATDIKYPAISGVSSKQVYFAIIRSSYMKRNKQLRFTMAHTSSARVILELMAMSSSKPAPNRRLGSAIARRKKYEDKDADQSNTGSKITFASLKLSTTLATYSCKRSSVLK